MNLRFKVFFPWESEFNENQNNIVEQDVWRPPADIFETQNNFYIEMELPGIEKDKIEINVIGNRLEIKGDRRQEKRAGEVKLIRNEIPYGFFLRTFKLPGKIVEERIEAKLENGVLRIKIPKCKINVTVEGE